MNKNNLIWTGAVTDPSGYAEASRGYLVGLSRFKDYSVKLVNRVFWAGDPPDLRASWSVLNRMNHNNFDRREPHISIQHLTPEQYLLSSGNCIWQIGMTTFETTSIPAAWQIQLRAMDEIFTFSKWSKTVFEESGIRRPITVVPHGVNIVKFNPGIEPLDEMKRSDDGPIRPDDFVFGSNFDWTERKNPFALLRAYFTAFKAEDPVVLVLKSYYQFPLEASRQYIHDYIIQTKCGLGLTKTPRVVLMTDILGLDMLPRFYAGLNAYVLPSRGEGWGLTYSEAMASGLPTVAVNWSAHTEYMNDNNSYLCNDFEMETITEEMAAHQPHYVGHKWATVNFEEVGAKMRHIFEHRDEAQVVGQRARDTMVNNFTWGHAAQIIRSRTDQIFAG